MTTHVSTLSAALRQQERIIALTREVADLHDALGKSVYPGVTVVVDDQPHMKGMRFAATPTQERLAGATGVFIGLSGKGNAIIHTQTGPAWVDPDCLAAA